MSLKAIDWVDYRRGNHHIADEEKCTITPGNDGSMWMIRLLHFWD